jgi:hypothetical protein
MALTPSFIMGTLPQYSDEWLQAFAFFDYVFQFTSTSALVPPSLSHK